MDLLFKDFRFALRMLAKHPGVALVVIVTLGLGIGANTAIFSFVNAVLLRPLPYHESERLIRIHSLRGGEVDGISMREAQDMREQLASFAGIALYRTGPQYNISGDGRPPEEIPATITSRNLFEVLGAPLHLGQTWPDAYDQRRSFGVVLSYDFWQRRYGGDPDIVGRQITMDGHPAYDVFGVAAAGFDFPTGIDVFRSIVINNDSPVRRDWRWDYGLARLKPGVSLAEARAELRAFDAQLKRDFPEIYQGTSLDLIPLGEIYRGNVRPYLLLLFGAVGLVLLIVCVNVVNLLLARAVSREKEVGVRAVLGAGRSRLIRQLLTESVVLALLGGGFGLLLAVGGVAVLAEMVRVEMPHWMTVEMDVPVLLFTFTVAMLAGVAAGLVPALQTSKLDMSQVLKAGRGATGSRRQRRMRGGLVSAEIALAVLVLIGAGLVVKSVTRLHQVDLGFEAERVLTFRVALPWRTYSSQDAKTQAFFDRVVRDLEATPGVAAAATNNNLPMSGREAEQRTTFTLSGQSIELHLENPLVNLQQVSHGYFEVMQIPVLRGQAFQEFEGLDSVQVAVINQRMAERFWPEGDALGQQIKLGSPTAEASWIRIIGVVGNVRHSDLADAAALDIYVPSVQTLNRTRYVIARTTGPPMPLAETAAQVVLNADPEQSIFDVSILEDRIADKMWQRTFTSTLFMVFGILAAVLAAVGLFGVMSYAVSRRTREIGVRKALGALQHEVLALVLREVATLAAIGVGLGVLAAVGLSPALESLLYEVSATDPVIFLAAPVLLTTVALLAALVPALRAARVNPVTALRHD